MKKPLPFHSSTLTGALFLVTGAACSAHAPPKNPAPSPTTSPARPTPALNPTATTPVASASASAHAGPTPPTFYVVNETEHTLSLFKIDSTAIVAGGPIFSKLDENGIHEDESFGSGLSPGNYASLTGLVGSFTTSLFATMVRSNGRTGWGELYQSRGSRGWSRVGGPMPDTYVHVGLGTWSDGRVLALEGGQMPIAGQPMFRFRVISGPPAAVPQLTAASVPAADDPDDQCKHWRTAEVPQSVLILSSGDVFAFGPTCQGRAQAVEHWQPGQTKARFFVFPNSSEWSAVKAWARSPREVTLLLNGKTGPSLAHFDGENWTTESLGLDALSALDGDLGADGTLFVVAHNAARDERAELWWRAPGQSRCSKLDVPAPPAPSPWPASQSGVTSILVNGKDDIWLVVGSSLLHSRPAPAGKKRISWDEGQQFPSALRLPKAANFNCNEVYVLLYAITQTTPANYDFPLTRRALAGHSEFHDVTLAETEDNGRRFFGAFVKDYAQGQKLSQLVQEKVKGSIPAVLCARPKLVREIKIDWRTGQSLASPPKQ